MRRREFITLCGVAPLTARASVSLGLIYAGFQPAAAASLILQVVQAQPGFDERSGEPIITITLTIASLLDFGKFTAEHIGAKMEMRVDGKAIATGLIREQIRGPFRITPLSVQQIADLAQRISSGTVTIEVEVAPN